MERRNTIQKALILRAVCELKRHLTADEVYEFVKKDHPSIGKGDGIPQSCYSDRRGGNKEGRSSGRIRSF